MNKWKTIEKGYLGQALAEVALIKRGFNLFKPLLENGKVDLIAEKDNKYSRIQIKTVQTYKGFKFIPLRKISHNMGKYKVKKYTSDDIDYFIGVDIESEDLYILPIELISKYSHSIALSSCTKYKNNFIQLEPTNRNISSEDDDNVESLTDNADGNDVGIN